MIRLILNLRDRGASKALRATAEQIPRQIDALEQQAAVKTQQQLQDAAPVSKPVPDGRIPGDLKKSIMFDLSGTVATFKASEIAQYVIAGTVEHDIAPQGEGYPLHFFWEREGGFVNFMKVLHPETGPNDFRVPALNKATDDADRLLEGLGDEISRTFAE